MKTTINNPNAQMLMGSVTLWIISALKAWRLFLSSRLLRFGFFNSCKFLSEGVFHLIGEFLFEFSVPGFDKKDFLLEVEENNLKVSKLSSKNNKTENNFFKRQFNYSQFEKNFTIPEEVSIEKINSKYENGILKIFLPKIKEFKQTKIKSIQVK